MININLIKHVVKAVEDALAQFADFLDLPAVLSESEVACSKEFHEESHVVPCEKEHEREGYEIAQSPPEVQIDPKEYDRYKNADRNGNQCADCQSEGADEHLVLDHLLEENLRNDEEKGCRNYGYSKEELTDIFVKLQYHIKPNKRKTILWLCFGDAIFENIKKNLETMSEEELNMAVKECVDCGEEFFVKANSRMKRCDKCRKKRRGIIVDKKCVDCGKLILVGRKKRCENCNRIFEREKKRKQRENKK